MDISSCDSVRRHEQQRTLKDVDILAAVDTDKPFANAMFVPVPAGMNQRLLTS